MSENHTHNHSSVLSVQVLVFLGLMGALSIVLSFVGTIRIGNYLRIGFSDLPCWGLSSVHSSAASWTS